MSAASAPTRPRPFGPPRSTLRRVLLVVLVAVGVVLLLGQPRLVEAVRAGDLGPNALLAGPIALLVLVLFLAADAAVLASHRGRVSGRSLVQLVVAVGFLAFLGTQTYWEYQARRAPVDHDLLLESLASSQDARVRALVLEVAGLRPSRQASLDRLILVGLDDKDPMVRAYALSAASRRAGRDFGDDVEAARAWFSEGHAP